MDYTDISKNIIKTDDNNTSSSNGWIDGGTTPINATNLNAMLDATLAIKGYIDNLNVNDSAITHQFITAVRQTAGKIEATYAELASDDIPDITASKISDLAGEVAKIKVNNAINAEYAINAINAASDENGNNIATTYATNAELSENYATKADIKDFITEIPSEYITADELTENYATKLDVNDAAYKAVSEAMDYTDGQIDSIKSNLTAIEYF